MKDSRKTNRIDPQFRAIAWLKVPTSGRVIRIAQPSMRAWPCIGAKDVDVRREEIPGKDGNRIPILIFTPKAETAPRPCLVYFHGGGFLFPAAPYHFELAKQYALEAECTVVFPDYRLAPEFRYPAQLDDCMAVYEWVLGNPGRLKIDPDRIAVGGDSAGGTLAAAVTLVLIRRKRKAHAAPAATGSEAGPADETDEPS